MKASMITAALLVAVPFLAGCATSSMDKANRAEASEPLPDSPRS